MRRFRFSLDAVLAVKRRKEEQLHKEFSAVLKKRSIALANLAALEAALKEMTEHQSASRPESGALDSFFVLQFEASRSACVERMGWQRGHIALIEQELDAKRAELVEASRETKVLEKLEETQYRQFLEKLNREEQSFLDELAVFSAARA